MLVKGPEMTASDIDSDLTVVPFKNKQIILSVGLKSASYFFFKLLPKVLELEWKEEKMEGEETKKILRKLVEGVSPRIRKIFLQMPLL